MAAASGLLALALILGHAAVAAGQLVAVNRPLDVAIGRTVVLDENVLAFRTPGEDERCKVEVAVDEPFYQRVGKLEPQVFDCEFFPGTVRYVHSGSPLLDRDRVKLRAYLLMDTDTVIETFYLDVNVSRAPYRVANAMMDVEVDEFNGLSDPVDMRILDFDFDRSPQASCYVRINTLSSGLPRYGSLIRGEGDDTREVQVLYENCDDFLYLNLRYQHVLPPSPDVDYIQLTVEVDDAAKHDRPFLERLYLAVRVVPAFGNQRPVEAFLAQYILDVNQFILTTITADIMSGSDDETRAGDLVFHIRRPPGPGEGSIVHLDDQSRPIESFRQADLDRLNIAYKAPSESYPTIRLIEIEFIVYDEYFASSDPITLTVAVHPTQTNAPRVSVNRGLTLLEGQSRPIRPQNFEVVDNDNIERVRIKVVGGPDHGRLLLNERPMIMFTPRDVTEGAVVYRHDGSDTLKDSVELRITDIFHTVHTSFPINVLPVDDSAPTLIRNIQIEVNEGQTVRITRFALLASDKDSSDDYIVYRITAQPSAGEILKKYSPDSFGYPVTEFTQRDLFRGLIYYHHLGREEFMDSLELVLLDNSFPPNVSPTQVVLISISPVHDLPPEIHPDASNSLTVLETEIAFLTRDHLRYTDTESDDGDLRYTITTPPYVVATHSLTDAGRIFSTVGVLMPMKDPAVPSIRTFLQRDVDHHTVAYMPPFKEIGPKPREIRLLYSMSDPHGNVILGQSFDITVLPVNNQPPAVFGSDLLVMEGGALALSPTQLTITDMDTLSEDLVITFTAVPQYGRLVVGNVNLTEGGTFSIRDLNSGNVRYVHGGSEVPSDEFGISVSDGVHSVSRTIAVSVAPVNDEVPELLPGLVTRLTLPEGGEVALTPAVLAATDADTNDLLLHFVVIQHPRRGVVLRNGIIANRFTQLDVRRGSISYVHMGGETGKVPVQDSITFVVSDKSVPSAANLPVHDVDITITPVDNQAPGIVFGNPYFVEEGGKAALSLDVLSAIDRDSDLDQLTFHIVGQPEWGLVENILPSPGYEKSNAGKPIDFFHYRDILDGNINYVQSNHSRVEPVSDTFLLYVSDGKHPSPNASFIVNIIPVNDERPTLIVGNFTVFENSFFKLGPRQIHAGDLDVPMEMLMFSVVKAPQYGSLVDWSLPADDRLPVFDFNLNQLLNTLRLTYVHDGSESTADHFSVRVTDGKHTVHKTVHVDITPVNDQPPEVVKNAGITIDIHESRIISPVQLLTTDGDTPAEELLYTILTSPKRGVLQHKLPDDGTWVDLPGPSANFTQADLDRNLIRYLHTSELGSKGLDRFRFAVTDGVQSTGKQSFRVEVTNTKREPLQLVNAGAEVLEGRLVVVSPERLAAFDNNNNPAEIVFTVTTPPTEGQLEDIARPGSPVSTFSQIDLVGQRIVYIHRRTDRVRNDNFQFSVTNGYQTRNDTFHVVVVLVDDALPALLVNEALEVPEGGIAVLPPANLEAIDQDTPPHSVTFVLTQPPRFGTLTLAGLPVVDRFTQQDVNNYDLSYQHDPSLGVTEVDRFRFVVTDNTNRGFLVDNAYVDVPVEFRIRVDRMDSEPPRLVTNQFPLKMLARNGRYAFVLSQQTLRAEDQCPDSGLTFTVTREPQHGFLEHAVTRQRVERDFTQQEVNDRSIMYVMRDNLQVFNDSFMFSIYDCNGNALMGQRFEFRWSLIQFVRGDYTVCETVGTLQVNVRRLGHLAASSFVDIAVSDLTAEAGRDYAPPRARQLQFDPGVASAAWEVAILADDLEENRERFRLQLAAPVNAVLGDRDKLTVIIKDAKNGVCKGEDHGVTITDTLPSCCPDVGAQPPVAASLPSCCPDQGAILPGIPHPGPAVPEEGTFVYPPDAVGGPVHPDGYPVQPGPHPAPDGYVPVPQGGQECCDPAPGPGGGYPVQPDAGFNPYGPGVYPQDTGDYRHDPRVYPEHPGVYPQNPEVYPQNPEVYPQNPGVYPQNPGVYPQNPGVQPQNPGVYPQNQGTYPQNQGTYPQNQGTYPQNQGTYPQNQGTYPQNQGTYPQNQGTYPQNPGVYPPNPGTYPQNPGTYPQNPGLHQENPAVYPQNPDVYPDAVGAHTGNPVYPDSPGAGPHDSGAPTGWNPQYPDGAGQFNPRLDHRGSTYPDGVPGEGPQPEPNPDGSHPSQPGDPAHPVWPYYTADGQPYIPGQGGGPPVSPDSQGRPYYPPDPSGGNPRYQGGAGTEYPSAGDPYYSQGPDRWPGQGQRPPSVGGAPVYAGRDPNPNPAGVGPAVSPGRVSNGQAIQSRPGVTVPGQVADVWTNGSTTVWTLHGIASTPGVVHGQSSASSSSSSSQNHRPFPSVVHGQSSGPSPDRRPAPNPGRPDTPQPDQPHQPVDQPQLLPTPGCTTTRKDNFLFEEGTGQVYQCDGNRWIQIEWSNIQADGAAGPVAMCEEGWSELDGMCYLLVTEPKTWDNAQKTCKERHRGNLIAVATSQIYNWLRSQLERREIWIGLNAKHTAGQWEWAAGTPVAFTRWKVGSPVPSGPRGTRRCVSMNHRSRWVEKKCDNNAQAYMCQRAL